MGWRGTARSINSILRECEREQKKRERAQEKLNLEQEEEQILENDRLQVSEYNNYIERLISIHKECGESINWDNMVNTTEPKNPSKSNKFEKASSERLRKFKPNFIHKILNLEATKIAKLKLKIKHSISCDEEEYQFNLEKWRERHNRWKNNKELAEKIISGDRQSKLNLIEKRSPFREISGLGSKVVIKISESSVLEITLSVHSEEVIPNELRSLLGSGRLSVKKMPKGAFYELYQDHVCSSIIRVANEIFSILPDEIVIVTAVDNMLNTKTGHKEDTPILSVVFSRETLRTLNLNMIDPSDSLNNFTHKVDFKKTRGFASINRIRSDDLQQKRAKNLCVEYDK